MQPDNNDVIKNSINNLKDENKLITDIQIPKPTEIQEYTQTTPITYNERYIKYSKIYKIIGIMTIISIIILGIFYNIKNNNNLKGNITSFLTGETNEIKNDDISSERILYTGEINNVIDKEFNKNSGIGFDCNVWSIIPTHDNKILVYGCFTKYDNKPVGRIVKLNSNGTLDTSFNTSQLKGNNFNITDIEVQSDGKIIIGIGGEPRISPFDKNILRLLPTGEIDENFNKGGKGFNAFVKDIQILSNDDILVGGNFSNYNGETINRLAKLGKDGELDYNFSKKQESKTIDVPYNIVQLSQGKFFFTQQFDKTYYIYNSDGTIDIGFHIESFQKNDLSNKGVIAPSINIVTCGDLGTDDFNKEIEGYPANDLLQTNKNGELIKFSLEKNNLMYGKCLIDNQDNILKYGVTVRNNTKAQIYKFLSNGVMDKNFSLSGIVFNGTIADIAQIDNNLFVGGYFKAVDDIPMGYITKLVIK